MCGIVGFITDRQFDSLKENLPEALSSLSHRGPDDYGIWDDGRDGVGLGHRRLSIIDLSPAGRQPMESEDVNVKIVFNGEVYNFKEIREDLKKLGHTFNSKTDTEVILKAYIQWGSECLKLFIGMFSIAIWDGRKKVLFLARDRIGIKPLYYYISENTLIFASELKSIMAFAAFHRELDFDAFSLYLHFQFIPGSRTIFRNTYKLLPGEYAIFNGESINIKPYWCVSDVNQNKNSNQITEQEHLKKLDQLLTVAVSDRMISDVPLGALLSGGIDSSLVVSIMQKVSTNPVKTFSIGFSEDKYNEANWASEIADYLGTDHTEFYVTPNDALKVIPNIPYFFDEPFGDSSAIPTALVCGLTRSKVTVALSGDGGDELFSGYDRYWKACRKANILKKLPYSVKNKLSRCVDSMPLPSIEKIIQKLKIVSQNSIEIGSLTDKFKALSNLLKTEDVVEIYRMAINIWPKYELVDLINNDVPVSRFEDSFIRTKEWPLLSRFMLSDLMTILPDDYLTKVDRSSMAVGLEVRVPLLDHRIVEYSAVMPNSLKYRNGTNKYILRKILSSYLPRRLFERPKKGFGVPIDSWFKKELKSLLFDYLSVEKLKKEGLFNTSVVMRILNEHMQGKANHRHRIWALLMWEMWREKWMST